MRILVVALLLTACGSDDGDSGSSGPDQGYVDYVAAFCIQKTARDVYEANIRGKEHGSHDVTADCALGGKVHITGTTGAENSEYRTVDDLVLNFTDCRLSTPECSLTMSGTLAYKDTWLATHDATYRSEALTFSGTAKSNVETPFDESCAVAIVAASGDGLSGLMCGREFTSQQ